MKKLLRQLQRQCADLEDRLAGNKHIACFGPQPGALAVRTWLARDIFGQLFTYRSGVCFPVTPFQGWQNSFERMFALIFVAALTNIDEAYLVATGAIQNQLAHVFGKLFEWCVNVETVLPGKAANHFKVELIAFVPAFYCAGSQRHVRKCNHAFWVEKSYLSQTVAARTRSHRVVEREQPRLQ